MDLCVTKVQAKGHDKKSAIAICYDSIAGKKKMAAPDGQEEQPPDISIVAKLALALMVVDIVDRVVDAAGDAPPGMNVDDIADSLTDEQGANVAGTYANMFSGTHDTNIATNETAAFRALFNDPKFLKDHPYVMIVATNPNARLGHKMMDGYIMPSQEAQYSSNLPPFGFGCDCMPVALTVEQSQAMGLVGANPVGTLDQFLKAKGARPSGAYYTLPGGGAFTPGTEPGFMPPYASTDVYAQTEALRSKAEELRAEDPEAWAQLKLWVVWLFGFDILTEDPPADEQSSQAS